MSTYSSILTGGIEENNLQEALSYQPATLDVNSKVGINDRKSRSLIQRLVEKLVNQQIEELANEYRDRKS